MRNSKRLAGVLTILTGVVGSALVMGFSSNGETQTTLNLSGAASLNEQALSAPQTTSSGASDPGVPNVSVLQAAATLDPSATLTDLANASLQLNISPNDGYSVVDASGNLKIGGVTYPLQLNQSELSSITTPDGTMWFGPIQGSFTLPNNQVVPVIIGPDVIPDTRYAEASVTLEGLGAPVHLFFGNGFVQSSWASAMAAASSSN